MNVSLKLYYLSIVFLLNDVKTFHRHEMQHFVNNVERYLVNQIIHISWQEFENDLENNVSFYLVNHLKKLHFKVSFHYVSFHYVSFLMFHFIMFHFNCFFQMILFFINLFVSMRPISFSFRCTILTICISFMSTILTELFPGLISSFTVSSKIFQFCITIFLHPIIGCKIYLFVFILRSLLNKNASAVLKIILDIFTFILKFYHQILSADWKECDNGNIEHPFFNSLCSLYNGFKQYAQFLFKGNLILIYINIILPVTIHSIQVLYISMISQWRFLYSYTYNITFKSMIFYF